MRRRTFVGTLDNPVPRGAIRLGFTLIELLVVVAIISLLIAILLPSLAGAREQSQRVKCATNQRSCAIGALQYTQENRDWFNPIQDLHRLRTSNVEGTWRVYLWKYIGQNPDAVDCPTEPNERYADGFSSYDRSQRSGLLPPVDSSAFGKLHALEMYNASGIGANLAHYWSEAEGNGPFGRPTESGYIEGLSRAAFVAVPDRLILFGDGHGDAELDWPEDRWWIFSWTPGLSEGGPGYDRVLQGDLGAVRHAGRANYSFYDGSTRYLDAARIACTPEECWWSIEYRPHLEHSTQ